jgi:hypothetical protein
MMAMNKVRDIKLDSDQKLNQVSEILGILQQTVEQLKQEVDTTCILHQLGAETTLSRMIQETVSDPAKSLFSLATQINKQVKDLIVEFTQGYFKEVNRNLPLRVFQCAFNADDLFFLIVLESDNYDNRSRVFDFFDTYDMLDISRKFPVTFQFTPETYLSKFKGLKEIPVE